MTLHSYHVTYHVSFASLYSSHHGKLISLCANPNQIEL
jgi:hypothetical protein